MKFDFQLNVDNNKLGETLIPNFEGNNYAARSLFAAVIEWTEKIDPDASYKIESNPFTNDNEITIKIIGKVAE